METNYQPHLYMICYPNSALVLSHLEPEKFGFRYSYGSCSHYSGKLIFAEIDINYRHPFFPIDEALEHFTPHPNGEPKATKYVSCYRVLEFMDVDAVQVLYLCNSDGTTYALKPGVYEPDTKDQDLRVFAELRPLTMMTLAKYDMREFGRHFVQENRFLHVPRLMFMQVELDIDQFLREFDMDPFNAPPLEGIHPSKLRDAILDLRNRRDKFMKGLTLDTVFTSNSYRKIQKGIMLIDAEKERFFPMPSLEQIEKENLRFWKNM